MRKWQLPFAYLSCHYSAQKTVSWGTRRVQCWLGERIQATGQGSAVVMRLSQVRAANRSQLWKVLDGMGCLGGDLAYHGCRAACSHVYLLFGSFSIRFRMKSFAVWKESTQGGIRLWWEMRQHVTTRSSGVSYMAWTLWDQPSTDPRVPWTSICGKGSQSLGL